MCETADHHAPYCEAAFARPRPFAGRLVDPIARTPGVIVPPHCTGWRAQQRFAAALPNAFVPNAVGTVYTLAAPG